MAVRSSAVWPTLCLTLTATLLLAGCSSVGSWPAAILEGDHYELQANQVVWVKFVDRPQMRLDRTLDRTVRVVPADASSFRILNNRRAAVDLSNVYCDGDILEGADPSSIRVVPGPDPLFYLADQNAIWRDCERRTEPDGATFERLPGGYGRDARAVYFDGYILQDAHPEHFRVISDRLGQSTGYGVDGTGVWHGGARLPVVDPAGFRVLGGLFSTDGIVVLAGTDILHSADPASFRVTGFASGRDRSGCWRPLGPRPCT